MPELTAKLFRDFFSGSWLGRITKNGEFQREIEFNWPKAFQTFSSIGIEEGFVAPPGTGFLDNTKQIAIAGWRNDSRKWCAHWYNEFGGYGELQWISQDKISDVIVLHGSMIESKQEGDDATIHSVVCEIPDQDHFKYTIQSYRKGTTQIEARRIRTGKELKTLMEKQAEQVSGFLETTKK